jgi:hypothetical protein
VLALLVVQGCVTAPKPTSTGTTGDTGTVGTCADEVSPQTYQACVETTLAGVEPADYDHPLVLGGTGVVTEVGGDLDPVPGSAPVAGFGPCGPAETHQVRIVDEAGEIWTFGWDVSGAADDDSADAIVPGSELDFHASFVWYAYSAAGAVLLSDDVGPLFLLETGVEESSLEPDVVVELQRDESCVVEADGYEYYQVSFTWTDGAATLWPGDTATVPLPGRDLEVVLGDAFEMLDCLDGCSDMWWAGWAEAP